MSIDQILSRVEIDSAFSESEKLELENSVRFVFDGSETARDLLNKLIVEDETLTINFEPGELAADVGEFDVFFDFAALDGFAAINQNGDVFDVTADRVLTHEIVHAIGDLDDIDEDGTENTPDFDYTGDTVRLTNQIYTELGDPDQRVSYLGLGEIGTDLLRDSFTFGNEIDNAILANQVDAPLVDTSVNTTPTRDLLIGDDDDDLLLAGAGEDFLYGEGGDDTLIGGADIDFLSGGDGDDTLSGGTGENTLYGDGGNDTLSGGADFDFLSGGDGNDTLSGGAGDDILDGGVGSDFLSGNGGGDTLDGGGGDDVLIGGAGFDFLFGGEGEDVFVFDQFEDVDTILDFEKGQDRIDLEAFGITFAELDDNSDGVLNLEDEAVISTDDGRSTALSDEDGVSVINLFEFNANLTVEDFIF